MSRDRATALQHGQQSYSVSKKKNYRGPYWDLEHQSSCVTDGVGQAGVVSTMSCTSLVPVRLGTQELWGRHQLPGKGRVASKTRNRTGVVTHTCNPSTLGERGRRIA